MLYLLITIVEILVFFLVILAGYRVYRLYSTASIQPDSQEITEDINIEVQETHLPRKKPNAALDDYIGDFF